jgi:hypothetical protein
VPFVIALIIAIFGYNYRFLEWYIDFNPFVQAGVLMVVSFSHSFEFYWPQGPESAEGTFVFMQVIMIIYVLIGLLFLWRAKCRIRKKVF